MEGNPQKPVRTLAQSIYGMAKAVNDVNHPMWKGMPKIEGTMIHKFARMLVEVDEELRIWQSDGSELPQSVHDWLDEMHRIEGSQ